MILAGDIGGTNSRLAFFALEQDRLEKVAGKTYPSKAYKSLDDIVRQFLSEHSFPIDRTCFAIAGPVFGGRSATTNLSWMVDAVRLSETIGSSEVVLINDLEAIGYGLPELRETDVAVLNPGNPHEQGNRGIIAAGTGLGEAGAYWDGRTHHPFACEGGHTDFGPRDREEVDLLSYLQAKFGRVSYERLVSGPGLFEIYCFLRETGRAEEPSWLAEELRQQFPPPVIVRTALEETAEICIRALQLFVSIYGAEAGNLALKVLARGGIYLGGGIAPRIATKLRTPAFMESFVSKGRMRPLLEAIPVRVILNDMTGLLGAARYAVR